MTVFRTTLTTSAVALLALALYLSIALPILQDEPGNEIETAETSENPGTIAGDVPSNDGVTGVAAPETGASKTEAGNSRLLEFHGRVIDSRGQPVEGALVTEERYFFATTTDIANAVHDMLGLQRVVLLQPLREQILDFMWQA